MEPWAISVVVICIIFGVVTIVCVVTYCYRKKSRPHLVAVEDSDLQILVAVEDSDLHVGQHVKAFYATSFWDATFISIKTDAS